MPRSKYDGRPTCLARLRHQTESEACQNSFPCPLHCGAVCKQDKKFYGIIRFCPRAKRVGMPHCQKHGGASLKGIASPRYKNGLHSKHFGKAGKLLAYYAECQEHPRLIRVRDQIALLGVRELELTERLNSEDLPPWGSVVDALVDYENALRGEDDALKNDKLRELCTMIRTGADPNLKYDETWAELREVLQEKARLVAVEQRLLEINNNYLPVKEALAIFKGLQSIVLANVEDAKARMAIESYIMHMLGKGETIEVRAPITVEAKLLENKKDDENV